MPNTFDHIKFAELAFDARIRYLSTLLDFARQTGCETTDQCIAAVVLYTGLNHDVVDMAVDCNFELPGTAE